MSQITVLKRMLVPVLLGVIMVGAALPGLRSSPATAVANEAFQIYLPVINKPLPPPIIEQFAANVTVADPGDTITLTWQTLNADAVTLFHLLPTGQFGAFWEVEAAGTMTYTISSLARNQSQFMLTAVNSEAVTAQADLTIQLICPDPWFFAPGPDICSTGPALLSNAAEQYFEYGTMLWIEETMLIYVLYADDQQPQWQVFVDEWQEGDPIEDPGLDPPPGLYQPQRGFGLIWREQDGVQDRLGWALAPEEGYETAVQSTSYPIYNDLYIQAADEEVWQLGPEGSEWEKFHPLGAAQAIADLINQARANHGLPPYQVDSRLIHSSQRHNSDMAHNHFTGHIGSDGSTPLQRMSEAGYNWHFGGEIIGWGFSGSHQAMFNWWMNSSIHRQMILSPTYQHFGLSYIFMPGSDWGHYWTVNMAKPLTTNAVQIIPAFCLTVDTQGSSGGASAWQCTD